MEVLPKEVEASASNHSSPDPPAHNFFRVPDGSQQIQKPYHTAEMDLTAGQGRPLNPEP